MSGQPAERKSRLQEIQEAILQGKEVQRRNGEIEGKLGLVRNEATQGLAQARTEEEMGQVLDSQRNKLIQVQQERNRFTEGLGVIAEGFAAIARGMQMAGLDPDRIEVEPAPAPAAKTTETSSENILVDPDSRRVTIGRPTGVVLSEAGLKLVRAVEPGAGTLLDEVRSRLWGRRKRTPDAVRKLADRVNADLGPVLADGEAVGRVKPGTYVRNERILVLGEEIRVPEAPVVEAPAVKPLNLKPGEVLNLGELAEKTGANYFSLSKWGKLLVEEKVLVPGTDVLVDKAGEQTRIRYLDSGARKMALAAEIFAKHGTREEKLAQLRGLIAGEKIQTRPEEAGPAKPKLSGDVSEITGVNYQTTRRWIDAGVLKEGRDYHREESGLTVYTETGIQVIRGIGRAAKDLGLKRVSFAYAGEQAEKIAASLAAPVPDAEAEDRLPAGEVLKPESAAAMVNAEAVINDPDVTKYWDAQIRDITGASARDLMELEQSGRLVEGVHFVRGMFGKVTKKVYLQPAVVVITDLRNSRESGAAGGEPESKKKIDSGIVTTAEVWGVPRGTDWSQGALSDEVLVQSGLTREALANLRRNDKITFVVLDAVIWCLGKKDERVLAGLGITPEDISAFRAHHRDLANRLVMDNGEKDDLRKEGVNVLKALSQVPDDQVEGLIEINPGLRQVVKIERRWIEEGRTGLHTDLLRAINTPARLMIDQKSLSSDFFVGRTYLDGPFGDRDSR